MNLRVLSLLQPAIAESKKIQNFITLLFHIPSDFTFSIIVPQHKLALVWQP